MRIHVEAVGLCGPGLDGWAASRAILSGIAPYEPRTTRVPPTTLLPANERRRAVQTVRLAVAAGAEAFAAAGRDPAVTPTVFASSGGDGDTIHEILKTLATPDPELSPTRFHNSVHNVPAGYWGIAVGSHAPSSSLCCHDDSFAAGLLEAAAMTATGSSAVALIAYDVQYPEPLRSVRPIGAPFAAALVLSSEPTPNALASIDVALRARNAGETKATVAELESLRATIPAARSLPLLEVLARGTDTEIVLPYLAEMELLLSVRPTAEMLALDLPRSATA